MEDVDGNPIEIGLPPEDSVLDADAPEPVVDSEPELQPVETEDEAKNFIKLDKREIAKELARLAKEDPEAANTLFSHAGRKTADRYQSRIEELEIQAREAKRELRAKEISEMPDEEIEHKFATDPAFAKEYAEVVHRNPNAAVQEIEARRMGHMLNDTIFGAVDYGLPADRAAAINQALLDGVFDKTSDGRPLTPTESIMYIQQVVLREISNAKASVPEPVTAKPSALSGAGPDTSTTGIVRSQVGGSSLKDYERILKSGNNLPSSEEIDRITAQFLEEN